MWKLIRRIFFITLLVVLVLNWTWGRLPGEPPAPSGSKYATVGDTRVHYIETEGKEPAVLMVHGLPGTYGDFGPVQQVLKGRRTISIDRPGYGYSSGDYMAFADQLKLLNGLSDELGLKRPVIAGHSYGGTLALAYARSYPDDTRAVVAVDPAVDSEDLSAAEVGRGAFVIALQQPVIQPIANATFSQALFTFSAETGDKQAFDPDPVDAGHEQRLLELNMKKDDLNAFGHEMIDAKSVLEQLAQEWGQISRPVFVIQGKDDKLVSTPAVQATTKELPRGRYVEVDGGHMQTYTHPREVAALITRASAVK
jgi:pimeloyl-ACP methyl ester carboxylesterase